MQEQLAAQMEEYGYRIVNVLIIDVEPDGELVTYDLIFIFDS